MLTIKKNLIVKNKLGLHARPAALFVQIANKFDSEITVTKDDIEVNGKSIMGILMLAAERDSAITIKASGHDAEKAVLELERILEFEDMDETFKLAKAILQEAAGSLKHKQPGLKRKEAK